MVSSIKGNIGHCEAASGAAGLAKLLLMLREKQIFIQAGFENINPHFADLESTGFVIPRQTAPWNHLHRTPRRAMLNNFGAAGSNTSLLLEEWVEPQNTRSKPRERSAYVFALSARSQTALQAAVDRHLRFLKKEKRRPSLKDICYTLIARRQIHNYRISAVCTSIDDLWTKLEHCKAVTPIPAQQVCATVFVFSGQGGFYDGMGEELMYTVPLFKEVIKSCDSIIQRLGFPSILSIICKNWGGVKALDGAEQVIASQCACVALEYALAKVFKLWGLMPEYVIGHRYGQRPEGLLLLTWFS